MATPKIKRVWTKLAVILRLAYFKKIIDNLKKTPPPIATPNPTTAALDALYTAAAGTIATIEGLEQQIKSLRETRDSQIDELAAAIALEGSAVIAGTGGDPAQIIAIGYDLVSDVRVPVGPVISARCRFVQAFHLRPGEHRVGSTSDGHGTAIAKRRQRTAAPRRTGESAGDHRRQSLAPSSSCHVARRLPD